MVEIDKILDVDTLITHIKHLKGYIAEGRLVTLEKGWVATLYKDGVNLGAFIVLDKVKICIGPYYYDKFEEGVVVSKTHHGVPLAYEHLEITARVELFNKNAKHFVKVASEKQYTIPSYEIKDLKPFKFKL